MLNPVVSIIVPSYNKEKYISETINSVLAQTYSTFELLIIDDLSNDSTESIVKSFVAKDARVKLFTNSENKGANYSRNYGIKQAKGKYIIFLDADDILLSSCLLNRVNSIENTNSDFCVFTMQIFKNVVGDLKYVWNPNSKKPLEDFLSHNLPWQTMQPIWQKEFLISLNGFDESFKRLQDVELHTRALMTYNVKFKTNTGNPDCFYRTDEERKNFNNLVFLEKWVDSALQYYAKFYTQVVGTIFKKKLLGTIYKTHLQILFFYKTNRITKKEFEFLKSKLLNKQFLNSITFKDRLCFNAASFLNLLPFRIPGVNFIITNLLIL